MGGISVFGLDVQRRGDSTVLMPLVNNRPLLERVAAFERRSGFDIAGSYDGIHLRSGADYGWLRDYWTGHNLGCAGERPPADGQVWLLGCVCGVTGCWPLEAAVSVDSGTVQWHDLSAPFGSDRDYTGLGPFWFDLEQYLDAVASAAHEMAQTR